MRQVKYVLLSVLVVTGVVLASSDSREQFSVALQAPSGPVKTGSEVRVRATTTNTSDHEIRFARGFGEQEFDLEIDVRDEKGQTPPLTEAYRQLKEHPSSRWGSYSTYVLEPDKSFEDELVVTKLYVLTRPGKYTISVTRGQRPLLQTLGKSGVKSNSITVTVIP
jgi:hypothetical protein